MNKKDNAAICNISYNRATSMFHVKHSLTNAIGCAIIERRYGKIPAQPSPHRDHTERNHKLGNSLVEILSNICVIAIRTEYVKVEELPHRSGEHVQNPHKHGDVDAICLEQNSQFQHIV